MEYPNCLTYGFNQSRIDEMLSLLSLGERDSELAHQLQKTVILPNLFEIIEEFYNYLQLHREYREYFQPGEQLSRMVNAQESYLRTLGINFRSPDYFEDRLNIGIIHNKIGLPPRLHECAYSQLRQLIAEHIPKELEREDRRSIRHFMDRILSLDMALALESNYQSRIDVMQASINELEAAQERLRKQSAMDLLTGAASRSAILGFIQERLAGTNTSGETFSIAMCSLDNLKDVNDKYGHLVGDLVLKKAVDKILPSIRKTDMLGRYGGAEFIIALRGVDTHSARRVMGGISDKFRADRIVVKDQHIDIKLNHGIATAVKGDALPALLARADSALKAEMR